MGNSQMAALMGAHAAVDAIFAESGVKTSFPGYRCERLKGRQQQVKFMHAQPMRNIVPHLREKLRTAKSRLAVNAVYELVIDGLDEVAIARGRQLYLAASKVPGVKFNICSNYGGTLGPYNINFSPKSSGL